MNIHVSRLLEHWLDWDRDLPAVSAAEAATPTTVAVRNDSEDDDDGSSTSSGVGTGDDEDTTDDDDEATAKSLSLSPSTPTVPMAPLQRRRRAACRGLAAEADLSRLTLTEILEGQLSAGDEDEERMDVEEEEEQEQEDDLQSWLRRIICSQGCDDQEAEAKRLSCFLSYLLKGRSGMISSLY